jgi:hypothetical protein
MIEKLYGLAFKVYRLTRPVRAPHYLRFIRQFPCVGCATTRRQRDAMHTGPHGMGMKASDLNALPGCRQCHQELHQCGPQKFQNKHKIEFSALIEMFQGLYRVEFPGRHQELVKGQEAA